MQKTWSLALFEKCDAKEPQSPGASEESRGGGPCHWSGLFTQRSGFHIKGRNHCTQSPLLVRAPVKTAKGKMARMLLCFLLGLMAACMGHGVFMDRLASKKLCADDECVCKEFFLNAFHYVYII